MVSWIVLCVSTAHAQVIDLTPMQTVGYDDGRGEVAWKVNNPSTSADWFSVDFGSDAAGATMAGLWADTGVIGSTGGTQSIGYASTGAGGFPDLGSAVMQAAAVPRTDGFNSPTGYGTPCMDPGSDFHVLYNNAAGDTEVWMVSDTDGPIAGRSFFTSDSYTTATQVNFNWRLGYAGWPMDVEGTLLINGASSATIESQDDACLTFSACAPGVVAGLYLCTPLFVRPILPTALTTTGGVAGGPCSNQWTLCATVCCEDAGGPWGFCCVYADPCDLRPNGKPRVKVSTIAFLTIECDVIVDYVWGQKDDGIADFYIWKVQNPAGTGDWFSVNHGVGPDPCAGISTLTGVQLSSWDFCGTGPCWAEVGIYPELPGFPCVPDVSNPFTVAANPCMPVSAADGGPYPMTIYDVPDISYDSTIAYHVAAKWPTGDSCIWLGSDTDGTDSMAGIPIPNSGCDSAFTSDSYATGGMGITFANWCMKIDWR